MSDQVTWHKANLTYLTVGLHWLRLRLQHKISEETATAAEIADAETDMAKAAAIDPPPALLTLSDSLGLTEFEQELLFFCVAMELDTEIADFCAQIQGETQSYPTFALAFGLFEGPVWDVVAPEGPLRSWRLIEIHQSGVQPLTVSPIKADERIVNYLKGLNYLDDRLMSLVTSVQGAPESEAELAPSQQQVVTAISHQLQALPEGQRLPLIQLLGRDRLSKQGVAVAVTEFFGLPLMRLRLERLPTHAAELETILRLWQREMRLYPVALYLEGSDLEGNTEKNSAVVLNTFLDQVHGLFFLDIRDQTVSIEQPTLSFEVMKPTTLEQWQTWKQVFGRGRNHNAALLSSQFNFNLKEIQDIGATTKAEIGQVTPVLGSAKSKTTQTTALCDRLWQACLVRTRPQLDALAQRLDTKATWEDIVLPPDQTQLLQQIAGQVRHRNTVYDEWGFRERMNRGLGVNALFAGESGTGKTMAAEVIANDLQLNLYRIDLSAVVSKYIGETEKNLRRLFDAAEDGGAILFFDEADALFGKRSDVKDSHDRYANIEVNYLLQRIEAYRGLAILATNLKGSMDRAFMRRLRFVISFPFPSVASRQEMWRKIFPTKTPIGDLDYKHLGQLNLTGGSIHNIAINAAFAAAQDEGRVGMKHILRAARAEFQKLDMPIYEGDFRWDDPALVKAGR
ncbi:ATP-binding protein [Acaryochloris sp. IP29b_bin.137]|uniref:ATP-binding protein n=1 Tax=Acaryochloris sp. IP29b_bin.137 TaxID=2969217 RepID=UPI00262D8E6E|nr:ATP-binding protein [Acaryochloris sp. IP29b_bin.137]